MPSLSRRSTVVALAILCLSVVASVVSATPAPNPARPLADGAVPVPGAFPNLVESANCSRLWTHPVTAPIVDGYRPPSSPYGPGNRGLEYGTALGDPVVAAADGMVRFAGQVGGARFVVVGHPGGLRSTYGFLSRTMVSVGDTMAKGQQLAEAAPGFHLTARLGDRYRDPTPLLEETCYVARLVPLPADDAQQS